MLTLLGQKYLNNNNCMYIVKASKSIKTFLDASTWLFYMKRYVKYNNITKFFNYNFYGGVKLFNYIMS